MPDQNPSPYEGFYTHLFSHSSSAVFVHDTEGRVLEANERAADLLGCKREQLRAMPWSYLFAERDQDLAAEIVRSTLLSGQAKAEARLVGAGDEEVVVAVACKRFELAGKPVLHSVMTPRAASPVIAPIAARDDETDTQRLSEMHMVFSLSPNGMALLDEHERVQMANPAFARFMERTVSKIVGMTVAEIEQELNDRAVEGQPPLSLRNWEEPSPDETLTSPPHRRIRLARPKMRAVKCQFRRLGAGDGSDGAILSLQDITREDEVDQMKTRFLSAAAHELRNPMASISGFADLLTTTPQDSPVFEEVVGTIQNQASAMGHLIDELLELTRMGALGQRDLALERVDTGEWIRDTARQFRRQGDPRTAQVSVVGDVPVITCDREKLTRAVTNVLSNAFKYSDASEPVEVELSADADAVHICVRDRGMGMTAEDIARLCDPFFRADSARAIQGTGLGMSLVQEILNAHGGHLDVQSTLGTGTQVTVSVPRHPPA